MKTLLLILLCATVARAQLIDLTPGGFNPDDGLPPAYFQLLEQTFFDEAAHGWFNLPEGLTYLNGWVSRYGELDGGVYFFTNLFRLGDTPSASIWWDFKQTENGLTMLDVWGRKPDGTAWEHIYAVRRNKQRRSPPVLVTLDGMTFIQSIAFYGTDHRGRVGSRRPILLRDFAR
jgi:hypothetical protein